MCGKRFVLSLSTIDIATAVSKRNRECLTEAIEAGLHDIEENDITELLDSYNEELTNEELLEIEKEQEAVSNSNSGQ